MEDSGRLSDPFEAIPVAAPEVTIPEATRIDQLPPLAPGILATNKDQFTAAGIQKAIADTLKETANQ